MQPDPERIVSIEHDVRELRRDVDGLLSEVGGIHVGNGNHIPLRTRVHTLESNDEAARLLAQAAKDFRKGRDDAWSTSSKVLVTVAAMIGAAGVIVSAILNVIG